MSDQYDLCIKRKAAFLTLGCKVNQYETDAMEELLAAAGYEIVDFKDMADVYIINTCSVTNMADRKSRQMIHRARKMNPEAVVVAAGCYVQASEEKLKEQGIADILIGNNKKKEIVHILLEYFREQRNNTKVNVTKIDDISKEHEYEDLSIMKTDGHTRAYVKIQDGCNQFCSYCIIPYARGRIRSKAPDKVIEEIRNLAKAGYKEVVLTGIHLSSYGKDVESLSGISRNSADTEEDSINLLQIIRKVNDIPEIERIRLGSLEPRIITEEFIRGLISCRKVCPHFHLSLQSGCDATLARMNRHYTTADYRAAVDLLRRYYDAPALTTDVIAGFVGETEEEFAETLQFLKEIRLYEMHIFKYSVRKGTRAEKMQGHLPEEVKTRRSTELLNLSRTLKKEYEDRFIGSIQKVLLEEKTEIDGVWYMQGHTERYVKIAVKYVEKDIFLRQNQLIDVKVQGFLNKNLLFGKLSIEF